MSQITWKNISAPNFGGAIAGMRGAARTLEGALDPLEDVLKDRIALNDRNWETGKKNNNLAIKERLQEVNNLSELNQADDQGQFNLSKLREAAGAQFSPEVLETGVADRRKTLQDKAYGASLSEATGVADESLSLTDGLTTLRNNLSAAGMRPEEIQKREADFLNSNAGRKAQYADTIKKNTLSFIDQSERPKTREDVNKLLTSAEQSGAPMDREMLTNVLNKRLTGYRDDIETGRKDVAYDKGIAEEKALNTFVTGTMQAIGKGEDPNAAIRNGIAKSGLKGMKALQASNQVMEQYSRQFKLRPEQEMEYQQLQGEGQNQMRKHKSNLDAHLGGLQKQWENTTGISGNLLEMLDKIELSKSNIIEEIMPGKDSTWLHPETFLPTKQGKAAMAVLNNKLQEIRKHSGVSEKDAKAILWLATTDGIDENFGWWGSGAIHKKALDRNVKARMLQYGKGVSIRQRITRDTQDAENELADLQVGYNGYTMGFRSSRGKGNVTGQQTPIQDFVTNIQSIAPRIPGKTFGVLGRAKKEKAAAEAKVAEKALKKRSSFKLKSMHSSKQTVSKKKTKTGSDRAALEERIKQETQYTGYQQPGPEAVPFTFKKRPQ